jgi:hypothetical protein
MAMVVLVVVVDGMVAVAVAHIPLAVVVVVTQL